MSINEVNLNSSGLTKLLHQEKSYECGKALFQREHFIKLQCETIIIFIINIYVLHKASPL